MDNGGGMEGMMMMPPSPASTPDSSTMNEHPHHKMMMMMHMTFFWGKDVEILFDGWPGSRSLGMYLLSLLLVFFIALLVEWLSFCRMIKPSTPRFVKALLETVLYGLRIGLGYLVMLSVMSFNGGVLLVAVAGHALGFLLFGSSLFRPKLDQDEDGARPQTRMINTDLPARKC